MGAFLRRYATPVSLVVFAVIGISGVLMFFGVHNQKLSHLHEIFGIAFVIVAVLHLLRNGQSFKMMLRQKRSQVVIGVLGVISAVLLAGAISAVSDHGNPMRAQAMVVQQLANAPITQIAPAFGLTADQALGRLRQAGVQVADARQTLAQVSQGSDFSPPQLFQLLLTERGAYGNARK